MSRCGSVGTLMMTRTAEARAAGWRGLSRPVLRDGLHVVRRDDSHLQVGLDPPDRLVLPDRPGLHEALTHLDRRPPPDLQPVVDDLVADGWVVDAATRQRQASLAEARFPVGLEVHPLLDEQVPRACAAAGLRRDARAVTRLVVSIGEPRRAVSDALVREDVAHLWVALLPRSARIGPFVEPGVSACLRCVDAHLGDRDPRRATVLHQLEDLPPTVAEDPDPCLSQLAIAWAVRDVVRRLDGSSPALRSATVTVTSDLAVSREDWLRHPHCGCAWG